MAYENKKHCPVKTVCVPPHQTYPTGCPVGTQCMLSSRYSRTYSSDESLNCDRDNFGYGITREEPKLDSWVGVKLEKGVSSCKGRKVTPFEVYIARITKVEEDGFEISFLKERSPGFYVVPDYADLSYPHRACELAVLEPPNPECRGRVNGFAFTTSIKEILISHFKL